MDKRKLLALCRPRTQCSGRVRGNQQRVPEAAGHRRAIQPEQNLRHAHERNDEVLERIYLGRRIKNNTERLEKLFELYTLRVTAEQAQGEGRKNAFRRILIRGMITGDYRRWHMNQTSATAPITIRTAQKTVDAVDHDWRD
ncbi:MAG: hypothetical protein EPN32_05425 [Rhodanobacter sp.]|nr:MAG: hypothetical protein EPN32_05425 [Rhodanobacter sp.]